jgi:hypothetical protein
LVRAVNACSADSPIKAAALARLLGFSARMTLRPGASDDLHVTADVAYAPRFDAPHGVSATVDFRASPAWSISGATGGGERRLGVGEHARATASLRPVGTPQFGTVAAAVTVREDGASFTLSSEETIYPSINAWWVIGAFDCPHAQELKPVFPPEREIDLKATYPGHSGAKIAWRRVERKIGAGSNPRGEFFIDLHKALECKLDHVCAYALTYLHAPRALDAVLALGSDDGNVVWLNGREVHRNHIQRGYATREDRVKLHLRHGSNAVLIKIGQAEGGWGFGAHLENDRGEPLTEVRVSMEP